MPFRSPVEGAHPPACPPPPVMPSASMLKKGLEQTAAFTDNTERDYMETFNVEKSLNATGEHSDFNFVRIKTFYRVSTKSLIKHQEIKVWCVLPESVAGHRDDLAWICWWF